MEEVGVEAVVKGLTAFLGDIRKINSGLDSIRPQATLLERAFSGAFDALGNFGREVLNVVEFALGSLLADAVNFAIEKIGELVQATIDAGSEFQTLELRLQRLNFNSLIDSGMDFNDAQREAIELTQDQLQWLQKLAAQTPYDNTDISNVFTLARSYGFAGDQAQRITEDVANFAAGMGLGNTEIERIIVNFGQMVQLGKVTQRELNDLARGSFVPVNDVLKEMEKNTGLTGSALDDFLKTTEGVDAFMQAFSSLVAGKFGGAAEQMARTFKAASANALDLVKSIGGLNIVKPILDLIGGKIADFVNQFTQDPQRWDRLVAAATHVGDAIRRVIERIFNLIPTASGLADSVIGGLEGIATWIDDNQELIVSFFVGIGDTIKNNVIPFIRDQLIPAIQTFADWVNENKDTIFEFFGAIGDIIADVFANLVPQGDVDLGFLDNVKIFMQFVIDNKDAIGELATNLIKLFIAWQLVATAMNIVVNAVISLVGFIISLIGTIGAFMTIMNLVSSAVSVFGGVIAGLGPVLLIIIGIIGTLIFWVKFFQFSLELWASGVPMILDAVKKHFEAFKSFLVDTIARAVDAFRSGDWAGAGRAIVEGIVNGIRMMEGFLYDVISTMAFNAYESVLQVLGIHSPSTLFEGVGESTMEGFALGIQKYSEMARQAMTEAMQRVAAPAMMMPALAGSVASNRSVTNNSETSNNYNLTVNSRANTEPIIQDFHMLQSMQG